MRYFQTRTVRFRGKQSSYFTDTFVRGILSVNMLALSTSRWTSFVLAFFLGA